MKFWARAVSKHTWNTPQHPWTHLVNTLGHRYGPPPMLSPYLARDVQEAVVEECPYLWRLIG